MADGDGRREDDDMAEEMNGRIQDDNDAEEGGGVPYDFAIEEEDVIEIVTDDDSVDNYESGDDDETVGEDDNAEQFDVTLPSRHTYLGETQELRGRTMQDENDYITIPLLHDNNLLMNLVLVPTQTLPMTVFHPLNISMLRNVIAKDRTFGIVHTKHIEGGGSEMAKYGTTAEIYEYQEEEGSGALSIKAKGRQRFKLISTRREMTGLVVAQVKILPEIRMENPFEMMRLQSLDKMLLSPPVEEEAGKAPRAGYLDEVRTPKFWHVRRKNAWLTPWPSWVYNQYDDLLLTRKVISELEKSTMIQPHLLKVPCDPQELSHWAAINLPLHDSHRMTLLSLNTPTQRLRYILSVLSKCKMLSCIHCTGTIANTADIFSMSVEGPQGTFVNPQGYVHEMLTLTKATNLSYYGRPSVEYSWFPGYAWIVATCGRCHNHIGWKFTATKRKLKPQKFYGLTRKSVQARLAEDADEGEMRHVI
ncbi:protein cereblon-like [Macrobrachium nipponense]|uniref:protein cereblon-like n=1 Tax=Macrobrachium nipponense TaxID=159736 RepID=UPI0030C7D717